MWLSIEWIGVILGLLASFLLAIKNISPTKAWGFWIVSDLLLMTLFGIHTGQYGLLFMHFIGFIISVVGYIQWKPENNNPNHTSNTFLRKSFYVFSILCFIGSIGALAYIPFAENMSICVEWFGSLLATSGSLVIAAKHRLAPISWISWSIANLVILCLCVYTNQWGIVVLQAGYTVSNIYGYYTWIHKDKFFKKLIKANTMKQRQQKSF